MSARPLAFCRRCRSVPLALLAAVVVSGEHVVNVEEAQATDDDSVVTAFPRSVPELNRFTFSGNVLEQTGHDSRVGHWVVAFCPTWWEPCQRLLNSYGDMARQWEGSLNDALLTKEVRFAMVDCATGKVLCNEQSVESYPTVHRYHRGKRVASWSGGRKDDPARLAKWLDRQFATIAKPPANVAGSLQDALQQYLTPGDRALDAMLVLAVLALNFRAVCSNPQLWRKAEARGPEKPDTAAEPQADAAVPGTSGIVRYLPEVWAKVRPSLTL